MWHGADYYQLKNLLQWQAENVKTRSWDKVSSHTSDY